jgi:hypothetical protein
MTLTKREGGFYYLGVGIALLITGLAMAIYNSNIFFLLFNSFVGTFTTLFGLWELAE